MFSKWIPILMMLGIGAHSKEALTERLKLVLDLQRTLTTQMDLNTLVKQAQLDSIGNPAYVIPDFREFVRQNMEPHPERDITVDIWGTPYWHELTQTTIRVVSLGPDKQLGTPDDIESSGRLGGY